MKDTVLTPGTQLIANERRKQLEKHNYSLEHDAQLNQHNQLSEAASILCMQVPAGSEEDFVNMYAEQCPFEWNSVGWKKMLSKTYKERLMIAGALIAAEMDRVSLLEIEESIN